MFGDRKGLCDVEGQPDNRQIQKSGGKVLKEQKKDQRLPLPVPQTLDCVPPRSQFRVSLQTFGFHPSRTRYAVELAPA